MDDGVMAESMESNGTGTPTVPWGVGKMGKRQFLAAEQAIWEADSDQRGGFSGFSAFFLTVFSTLFCCSVVGGCVLDLSQSFNFFAACIPGHWDTFEDFRRPEFEDFARSELWALQPAPK
jgi:hypothetical protein